MEQPKYQYVTQNPSLACLFLSFIKLGITAFGGPAMIVYIRKMVVEEKKWLDEATFRDGVALCQTIPGATAMQTCAYTGLKVRGVAGAAASFIGFGLPAFFIMMILSALYVHMYSLPAAVSALNGLQVIVVAIVANATLSFWRTSLKNWWDIIIAAVAAVMFGFELSPIMAILLAAFLGLIVNNRQLSSNHIVDPARMSRSARPLLFLLLATATGSVLLFLVQRRLFDLAALMFKIDLFAFGGDFASLPLMFHEIVNVHSWLDSQTLLNGIALGQITPGPIVITATFIGYILYGPSGALISTVSVFLPSFLIVIGITPYFDRLRSSLYFNKTIGGILCSFVGLLLSVTIRFALNIPWDFPRILLGSAVFVALLLKVDIFWVVLIGTIISVIVL